MMIVYLVIQVLLLLEVMRRTGMAMALLGYLAFLVAAHLVLDLVIAGWMQYAFLHVWSTRAYIEYADQVHLTLFVLSLLVYCSSLGIKRDSVSMATHAGAPIRVSNRFLHLTSMLVVIHFLAKVASVNFDLVWLNSQYLLLNSSLVLLRDNAISSLVLRLASYVDIVTAVVFAYALINRKWLIATIIFPIFGFDLLYQIAGGSRQAVVVIGAFSVFLLLNGQRPWHRVASILGVFATVYVYSVVLEMRGAGVQFGFSTLPDRFQSADIGALIQTRVTNLFEGVFVLAEHFRRDVDYNIWYKVLSLSPFPSLVDGFDQIRVENEIRIHVFVPRGAIDEILRFGWPFAIVYFGTIYFAIRLNLRGVMSGQITSRLNEFLLLLSLYLQMTYSVRTMYRIFLLVIFVELAAKLWQSLRKRRALRVPTHQSVAMPTR